jgi:aerobic carbon-monoxide dehydrogenase medium subunit
LKPSKFSYFAPETKTELLRLKAKFGVDGRLLAGGQSLVPMMNFRLTAPSILIDLNRLPELSFIEQSDEKLKIGAMTSHRAIEFSSEIDHHLPLLKEAVHLIAHLPIRTRGTIGGSIAHADPSAEHPMIMFALDGEVVAESVRGTRKIPAADLFISLLTTTLAADEVITEIDFPVMKPDSAYAVEEFARRPGDFAIAAVAVYLQFTGARCIRARIATAGIERQQGRLKSAEKLLESRAITSEVIEEVAAEAAEAVDPQSDRQGSSDFRRHLTRVLCRRALNRAVHRREKGSNDRHG